MWKDYLAVRVRLLALIVNHNHYIIIKLHVCLLMKIDLALLDLDQSVAGICDVQLDRAPQDQVNHQMVFGEEH